MPGIPAGLRAADLQSARKTTSAPTGGKLFLQQRSWCATWRRRASAIRSARGAGEMLWDDLIDQTVEHESDLCLVTPVPLELELRALSWSTCRVTRLWPSVLRYSSTALSTCWLFSRRLNAQRPASCLVDKGQHRHKHRLFNWLDKAKDGVRKSRLTCADVKRSYTETDEQDLPVFVPTPNYARVTRAAGKVSFAEWLCYALIRYRGILPYRPELRRPDWKLRVHACPAQSLKNGCALKRAKINYRVGLPR